MAIIGHTINLAPETTYYFRLHCGGDTKRGTFMTLPAMSGPSDQIITREVRSETAATMEVEYGTSYSRYTDTIGDHATATASCVAGRDLFCVVPGAQRRDCVLPLARTR